MEILLASRLLHPGLHYCAMVETGLYDGGIAIADLIRIPNCPLIIGMTVVDIVHSTPEFCRHAETLGEGDLNTVKGRISDCSTVSILKILSQLRAWSKDVWQLVYTLWDKIQAIIYQISASLHQIRIS